MVLDKVTIVVFQVQVLYLYETICCNSSLEVSESCHKTTNLLQCEAACATAVSHSDESHQLLSPRILFVRSFAMVTAAVQIFLKEELGKGEGVDDEKLTLV